MRLLELEIQRPKLDKEFPRNIMPQVRKGDLDDSPFEYNKEEVKLDTLKPVQRQRVAGMHDKAKRGFADGTIRPIIVDKDNYIVNGHHRYDIALSQGLPRTTVLKVDATIEDLIDHYSNKADDSPTFEQKFEQAMENFADGKKKGKSKPGRVKKAGASCDGSVTSLRKRAKNSSGEKSKMFHWCANMKSGKKKS